MLLVQNLLYFSLTGLQPLTLPNWGVFKMDEFVTLDSLSVSSSDIYSNFSQLV